MTPEVTSVAPETPIAEIASILERRRIKRVPVLDNGSLAGIVSRSDLVRALAAAARGAKRRGRVSDEAIYRRLTAELERETWWHPVTSNITVTDGVVEFAGGFEAEDERYAACVAAESIPGVRGVEDRRLHMRFLSSML